jgi:hypothetical protein
MLLLYDVESSLNLLATIVSTGCTQQDPAVDDSVSGRLLGGSSTRTCLYRSTTTSAAFAATPHKEKCAFSAEVNPVLREADFKSNLAIILIEATPVSTS